MPKSCNHNWFHVTLNLDLLYKKKPQNMLINHFQLPFMNFIVDRKIVVYYFDSKFTSKSFVVTINDQVEAHFFIV